ncbi:MAG: cysteine desulfurase family protein [Deltaproteobacteria bacterium]|nr:cysteine desulfurase family protein [Deltaproteobacteria bacterium]
MIYLDYNATTPVDREVAAAMMPFIKEKWGNPSSSHQIGREARAAVEMARGQVAGLLKCSTQGVVFTSGGTESNNAALKGVAHALRKKGRHIITSGIEHPSILQSAIFLMENGWEVSFLPVDSNGMVDPDDVRRAVRKDTVLISIMHANNETGTIQHISEIGAIARARGIYFHSDAAQSVGKVETYVEDMGVDFLTVAGHKVYAPKGIGALYIREGAALEPLLHGAGQEGGRRAGTENVILAAALGAACEIAGRRLYDDADRQRRLRDQLFEGIVSEIPDVVLNGHRDKKLSNTLNIAFPGLVGGEILAGIPGLCASTGAACHDRSVTLSHVLAAMGVPKEVGMGAIRLTVGRYTTEEEIHQAASWIVAAVKKTKRRSY